MSPEKKPKKTKKTSSTGKSHKAPCTKNRFCASMERALEGQDTQGPRRGFEQATMMNFVTGRTTGDHIAYRCKGRNAPLLICTTCPFCGQSIKGTKP